MELTLSSIHIDESAVVVYGKPEPGGEDIIFDDNTVCHIIKIKRVKHPDREPRIILECYQEEED